MDLHDWGVVKSTPLFIDVGDDDVRDLVGEVVPRVLEKGTLLFQQGEKADAFFIIISGLVKIYRLTPRGDEAVVGVFGEGETFAEAALFLGGVYPVCAEVVSAVRLIRIDRHSFLSRVRKNPDLALSMLASTSKHLKFLVEEIEQIKLLSAPRRIADFLLRLCPTSAGACIVDLPYEKALIANRLGMKPESFSRALAMLRSLGVTVERNRVAISDIEVLWSFAATGETGSISLDRKIAGERAKRSG